MSKDFDDDGRSERIGLNVDAVIILTSENSKGNHLVTKNFTNVFMVVIYVLSR
jgi:hypothetical protein